jgi:hypothetical protein
LTDDDYPTPWYQCMLPLPHRGIGTAADIVHAHFDVQLFGDLPERYERARIEVDRRAARVELLTERHGFEVNGKKYICPVMLEGLLDALPADEPLPDRGVGGVEGFSFEAQLRAFVYAPFYEVEDNGAAIHRALANNPAYLQRCGFPGNALPSDRALQRFNHVMNAAGLWEEARRRLVEANFDDGVLAPAKRLAIDPTHQDGYAGVRKPCAACRACDGCPKSEQVNTCDVTEIVAKRPTFQFPGVKGVVVTDVDTELPIAAICVPASTYDGKTGALAARAVAESHPRLVETVAELSLDGAYDVRTEKRAIAEVFGGADVLTPINPRGRKPTRVKDQRGVDHIDKYGVPHCIAERPMAYRGKDQKRRQYRFGCPAFDAESGKVDCPRQGQCCPNPGREGRQVRIEADQTPQVDWDNPQHGADFKRRYAGRTAVERTIGRSKRSLPFERHWGRGRASHVGHLAKTVLAFHVFVRAAHVAERPERGRHILTAHQPPRRAA